MKVQTLSRSDASKGIKVVHGIKILRLPNSGKQNLTTKTLQDFKQFISQDDKAIIFHTVDGNVVFNIDRAPGRYCLSCEEKMLDSRDDPYNEKISEHVLEHGKSAVTTSRWPHGYEVFANHYHCTIEDQRHG